ncbi:Unknown protein, partial [Striga hermonthica]
RMAVNEVSPGQDAIARQIAELTEQMRLLTSRGVQPMQSMAVNVCRACGVQGHGSEMCSSAFDQDFGEQPADANALQGYQNRSVNDPFSNTYKPGWRNHPNFSWANNNNVQQPRQNFAQQKPWPNYVPQQQMRPNYPQQQFQQQQRGPIIGMQNQETGQGSSHQDDRWDKVLQFMTNQESSIKRLETQVGQLATRVGNIEAEADKGKLPSQPTEAKAITVLRSGKVVNVNLPLLDVIKKYAVLCKIFQTLVTRKWKFGDVEKVVVYEAASAMHHDLPKKERDPGGFIIKNALGNGKEASGMLALGAGINLMPFSIFQKLGLGDLRSTRMCLQLADRSIRYPKGVVEDVLVRVEKLIVPVDFVVLDVGDIQEDGKNHTIFLGGPFMATTNTLIDVNNGTLNMTVLSESVSISVREATSVSSINFVEECAFVDKMDPLLVGVLQKNRKAIGWSLGDIEGISPSTCMHRIIEERAKPFRDNQRRLNPNMMEVVKKEILKLHSEGLIYPVASSDWVSPIHVVPKKGGITVIENDQKELVPTRITTGWRMCIDYRRLNAAIKKDHFPLPFIDQILDRLSGHQFYCFLDGLSGYYQVAIAPEDQPKTTFTCPFGTFAFRRMPFGLCNAPGT